MTPDEHKTKAELLQELNALRRRISEIEQAKREAAEYTLWNYEERYRSLLSNIPDVIWTTDCEGKTTFISPNVEELYGYKPEEIYRQGDRLWFGRIHPDDVEKVKEAYKALFEKGTRFDIEYRIKRKDGKWIWLHDRSIATYEKDGVMYADGLFSDITERKKAEDALKESEQKWRSLAENAPDVILTIKPDGTILFLNRTVPPFTPEKAVGTSVYNYVPSEYQDTLRDALERVVRTGEPYGYEIAGAGPDGRTSWYQSRMGPIKKGGQVVALTLIATDVTERKKAEEVLRESEEKYRKLFEETTDAIFVGDADTGIIIDCNRAASELVGREKSELIGKHQRILHAPQEIEGGFSKTFKQHIEEKEGQILEAQVITKMGEIKDVEIRASRFEQKSKKWIQGMFRDITERKKAEQALRESQSRQKAILDSIPDIAWLKDTESRYIAANEALCKAFGIKLEDFVGKTDFDISPEDLAKRYRADDQEVMKSGKRKRVEELWGKKEGERIWIETIKTPIYNNQGQVIGTSGIAREITERKKAEEQMREYREKMAQAERLASLGSLGAALAHEITQPLTVINLLIENALTELETTSYPGTVANKLKDVLTEVSRIKSVAQKFRDAARRSSERIIKEVDLKAVAERTLKLCDESARRAKVTLQLIDFDRLPSIYSNEEELAQVFFALVDNAIQAADGKKSHQLIISGIQKGEHVELRFSDNCSGIASEHLDKIFEPFFTTKPAGEATGLGLSIVEHVVSRAGGKVHVESKPGKGTTFYITLPIYIHAK